MMQCQRVIAVGTFAVAVLVWSAGPVTGQPSAPPPSVAFSSQSLHALRSAPDRASNARWHAVMAARPGAVLRAIARAEARGWKATRRTLRAAKGAERSNAALRPIALVQDFYGSNGDGEMLIWEWDDGDPNTAEGTIWVRSYSTGNEALFNVQFAGNTYGDTAITYGEDVDAAFNEPEPEPWVWGGIAAPPTPTLLRAPRIRTIGLGQRSADPDLCTTKRACYRLAENSRENWCRDEWARAGLGCLGRASRERMREGLISAAIDAGIMGTAGAFAGGLIGAVGGAVSGAGYGFLSGVIESTIRGADFDCRSNSRLVFDRCMREPMDYSTCDSRYPCGPAAQPAFQPVLW